MQVRIRLFAGLRERAGTGARTLDLADGATLGDVWPALGLGDEPAGLLYAVNKRYADEDAVLADGDEVALIPPVSGGDFRLTEQPLTLDAVVREVQRDEAGAVATSSAPSATARAAGASSTSSTRRTRGWPRR
jgi:molybdopterin converting factor subunit 1